MENSGLYQNFNVPTDVARSQLLNSSLAIFYNKNFVTGKNQSTILPKLEKKLLNSIFAYLRK